MPPATTLAADAGDGESVPVEAEIVLSGERPRTVEGEVVSATGSRPAQLLFSPDVQSFINVLMRIKRGKGGDNQQAFAEMLANLARFPYKTIPDNVQQDMENFVEWITEDETQRLFEEESPRFAQQLAQQRLSNRVPDIVENVLDWEEIFPDKLADSSGVSREELKTAFRRCAAAVTLQEVASWSDEELQEAADLLERNEPLREVRDAIGNVASEALQEATAMAVGVALTPLIFAVLLATACCFCISGGGGGNNGLPPPSEVSQLPLYGLGNENQATTPLYGLGSWTRGIG